jgi:hypothetical protein
VIVVEVRYMDYSLKASVAWEEGGSAVNQEHKVTLWIALASFFAGTTLAASVFIVLQIRARQGETKPFRPPRFIMILPPEFIGQPPNPDRTRWIPQGMYPTKEECEKDIPKLKMFMSDSNGHRQTKPFPPTTECVSLTWYNESPR